MSWTTFCVFNFVTLFLSLGAPLVIYIPSWRPPVPYLWKVQLATLGKASHIGFLMFQMSISSAGRL